MSNIKPTPTEWIYFFEEPKRHSGLIELGRTGRTVEDRNRDKRSVDKWREIASYPVVHCEQAEKEVIKATKKYRYNGRKEILEIDWPTLKTIVDPICFRYSNIEYNNYKLKVEKKELEDSINFRARQELNRYTFDQSWMPIYDKKNKEIFEQYKKKKKAYGNGQEMLL